jgi:hypothetical protein
MQMVCQRLGVSAADKLYELGIAESGWQFAEKVDLREYRGLPIRDLLDHHLREPVRQQQEQRDDDDHDLDSQFVTCRQLSRQC